MSIHGLVTAFRTLTILPVPGREDEDLASSLPWFPLTGLILGLILACVGWLWTRWAGTWAGGGAALLLAGSIFLTRGLHLDGLADWADALGARPDRDVRLAVMKDSRLGSFGGLALGIVLIAKWTAFEQILSEGIFWLLPVPLVVSRTMMAEIASRLPYARADAGTAGPFVRGASGKRRLLSLGGGLLICAAWGIPGLFCFLAGWVVTFIFARHCRTTFGGVTGDLLGTLNEITETGLLFLCGLLAHGSLWYTLTTPAG